jgi:hypothetical protein
MTSPPAVFTTKIPHNTQAFAVGRRAALGSTWLPTCLWPSACADCRRESATSGRKRGRGDGNVDAARLTTRYGPLGSGGGKAGPRTCLVPTWTVR